MELDELLAASGLDDQIDDVVQWARERARHLATGPLTPELAELLRGTQGAMAPELGSARGDEDGGDALEMLDDDDLELVEESVVAREDVANYDGEPEWKQALSQARGDEGEPSTAGASVELGAGPPTALLVHDDSDDEANSSAFQVRRLSEGGT